MVCLMSQNIHDLMINCFEYNCILSSPLQKNGSLLDNTIDIISNGKEWKIKEKWEPIIMSINRICDQMLNLS